MANVYADTNEVVLTIDGLQAEKGHETHYVVREVTHNRVWFAEPLLSGATDEIRRIFLRAKTIADLRNLKIILWTPTIIRVAIWTRATQTARSQAA